MDAILFVTFFTTLILIIFFNEYKKSKKNIEKLNENNEKNDNKNFVKISSLNNLKTEEETPKNKKKIFENEEIEKENNFKMKEPSKQDSLNDNSDLEIIKEEKNSPIFKTKVYNKISISKISNENFSNEDFNNISIENNDDEEEFDYKKMFSKFCDFVQKNKILKLSDLSKKFKTTNEETLKKLREIEKEEELIGYCNNDVYFYLTQNELNFLNDLFINSKKKKFKNSYLNNLFNEITSKRKLI